MGRISAGIGLISGLKTDEIIRQLIAFESRPLAQLQNRLAAVKEKSTALAGLTAQLLTLGLSSAALGRPSVVDARSAAVSNAGVLRAKAGSEAAPGSYQFRALAQAQAQRFTSVGFADASSPSVGAGTLTVKFGGFVAADTPLEVLNGGEGVARGKIRIWDRNGVSAVVDLSGARTVGDVLRLINNAGVGVKAGVNGDRVELTDLTGSTSGSLSVQEAGGTSTAADLGILGSTNDATLVGGDIVRLGADLKLDALNDANGVRRVAGAADLRITRRDGTTFEVDLSTAQTIGDVLDLINNDAGNSGGLLVAAVGQDGERLELTDSSAGGGELTVVGINGSRAVRDLGVEGVEQGGGVLSGQRVLAGLQTVLLAQLRGGGSSLTWIAPEPGQVQLTDRSGNSTTIDLSGAATLADVVRGINAAGLGLKAEINTAGHGITIRDTSGGSQPLAISDVTGNLASLLNIAGSVSQTTIGSGDLDHRYVSETTLLDRLGGGGGVRKGSIRITDSAGSAATVDLSGTAIRTVGHVIGAINAAAIGVAARINDSGDGIVLEDLAGGPGNLKVEEVGTGKTAADLRLLGEQGGQIDGAFRTTITIDAGETLNEVAARLNQSGLPLTAAVANDGVSATPYRLLLGGTRSGSQGRLLIDSGQTGLGFTLAQEAVDAVLELSGSGAGGSLLFVSSSNSFANVLPGLSIEVLSAGSEPVSVNVARDTTVLRTAIEQFVKNFNATVSTLAAQTRFDTQTEQRAVLQGDTTALALEAALFNLIGRTYGPAGSAIRGFAELGITLANGQLSLDESVLEQKLSQAPAAVREFFTAPQSGAAEQLKRSLDSFTLSATGTLTRRIHALDEQAADMESRAAFLSERLNQKQNRMHNQFLALEKALARLQSQEQQLSRIAYIEPPRLRSR